MNARIKELIEQCEDYGSWDNKVYTFDKEKFAELIVRECVGVVEESRISPDSGVCPVAITTSNIKKHFGVKE